jgi:hypothetical protein
MQIQPNTLTDEWGGTYLQIIIALLVLAAGIPGVLLQLRTAPEIHRVVMRRRYDRVKVMSGMLMIYILVALLFIWWFDSNPAKRERSEYDWSAALVLSQMLVLTALLWLRQIELTARDRIIQRLVQQAAKEFKQKNRLIDTTVSDILDLGTAASRTDERRLVLTEIREIARKIRRMKGYQGEGLEQLLEAVGTIATDSSHPVDEGNIFLAASILLENTPRTLSNVDSVAAARISIDMLARISVQIDKTAVSKLLQHLKIVEAFAPLLLARGLFRIGKDSLESGRADLAMTCLNHLEDVLDRCPKAQYMAVETHLVGLMAILWERYPIGHRRFTQRPVFTRLSESFTVFQRQEYMDYYLDQSDFRTAEHISSFCNELSTEKTRLRASSRGADTRAYSSARSQAKRGSLLHGIFLLTVSRLFQ